MILDRASRLVFLACACAAVAIGPVACHSQHSSASSPTAKKAAALRELHDSGVLSDAEYQQKLAALGGNGGAMATTQDHSSAGHNTWHLKKAEWNISIGLDPMPEWGLQGTPHKQVTGASMLIPTDWTFQARQDPDSHSDCSFNQGRLAILSASPDKKSAFLMLPGRATVYSNDRSFLQSIAADNQQFQQNQNCAIQPPQALASRMGAILKQFVPSATIAGSLEPIPGLNDQMGRMLQQANSTLAQDAARAGRPASRLSAEAGRIRVTNKDETGTGEGYLYVVQTVRTDFTQNGGSVTTTDIPLQFLTATQEGQLSSMESLFATMAGSIKLDPEYQAECLQVAAGRMQIREITKRKLQQIRNEIAADNARTAANIAAINRGVSDYRSQVMHNVSANRSAALEHSSQQFSLYMGDQAVYKDSATGQSVQLPSGSNHVWASTTGNTSEYILTDSPSYNPNGQVGSGSWSQMTMQR